MEILSPADILFLWIGLFGVVIVAIKSLASRLRSTRKTATPYLPLLNSNDTRQKPAVIPTRSILQRLEQTNKTCIIFYGSQTGTAERFAHRFSREALTRYGLKSLVADLDDFDMKDLKNLTESHLAVFILSTYGEGEPTDNAIAFDSFTRNEHERSLKNLRYAAFGLGSSNYTHYNAMIERTAARFDNQGARRIGNVGMGDDGKGMLEEGFVEWSQNTLPLMASCQGLQELAYEYRPAYAVTEIETTKNHLESEVFHGEPNKAHLFNRIQGPFTAQNPLPAKLVVARELFKSINRNCLHLEFDVSGTSLSYDTGDHLALWPVNSNKEVDLFLRVFGLTGKSQTTVTITTTDPSIKSPIPEKTTYQAAVQYYLDISGTVSRHTLLLLADFAVTKSTRLELRRLGQGKEVFEKEVLQKQLTLAQLLSGVDFSQPAVTAPFSLLLELIPKLKQRFYSISSSSLVSRKKICITAVVDRHVDSEKQIDFQGVSTGYLQALKDMKDGANEGHSTHQLKGPKSTFPVPTALIHVRRSKFRLPRDPKTPIIMIGPGTGVAPFRAFVEERVFQHNRGRAVGKSILFYGCRHPEEDYLYRSEWEEHQQALPQGQFSIFTAFSRVQGQRKVYVQDLIKEQSRELRDLILNQHAHIYICGDASRMCKDVCNALAQIIGGDDVEVKNSGFAALEELKKAGRWSEDVW